MPKKKSTKPARSRGRGGRGGGGGGSAAMKYIMIGGGVVVIGLLIWWIVAAIISHSNFERKYLDNYVSLTSEPDKMLGDGAGIYVDMSDGMNFAYSTPESQNVLKAVINKLAAIKGVDFFGLAAGEITPLAYNHTNLYNYMLNAANYTLQQAPIEDALDRIVANNQPALLMTDFEEYNGGLIQKAAYAKRAFIEWLAKGNNITFYKWDFEEKGKEKHMYLAVFDDNANRLNSLVAQAIEGTGNTGIDQFVLASGNFYFPLYSQYPGMKKGGNYHADGGKGDDVVTGIMDSDNNNDYTFHSYFNLVADANGGGSFQPLNFSQGTAAEFYPLGVPWADAIKNAKSMSEDPGVDTADRYEHLLSRLFVDFNAQSGYDITGIEVRTFDIQTTLDSIQAMDPEVLEKSVEKIKAMPAKEVSEFLTATMQPLQPQGFEEILVDFHDRFNGTITGITSQSNMIRANIVISQASLNTARVNEFFAWDGNESLAASVREALQSPGASFIGRVIFSYYLMAPEKK